MATVRALYPYTPTTAGQLPLQAGEVLTVVDSSSAEWTYCRKQSGEQGHVPANYLQAHTVAPAPAPATTPGARPTSVAVSPSNPAVAEKSAQRRTVWLDECSKRGFEADSVSEAEQARQETLRVLIAEEEKYDELLGTLVQKLLLPLRAATKELKIDKDNIEVLFGNVEHLQNFTHKRMMDLLAKSAASPVISGDGFILKTLFEELGEAYTHYFDNFPKAMARLKFMLSDKKNKGKFEQWVKEHSPRNGLTMREMLRAPLDRVTRYVELMTSIRSNTDPSSKDFANLTIALQAAEKILEAAQEENRWKHNFVKLKQIEGSVSGIMKDFVSDKKGKQTRWFVKEGLLLKHAKGQARQERYFFLLSDMILWTEKKGADRYKMCKHARLQEVTVKDLPDSSEYTNAFMLTHHPKKEYILIAPTAQEKQDWLSTVVRTVEAITGSAAGGGGFVEVSTPAPAAAPQQQQAQPIPPRAPPGTYPTATVLYDFPGTDDKELPLKVGQTVVVEDQTHADWWNGFIDVDGWEMRGMFPSAYVRLDAASPEAAAPPSPVPAAAQPPPPAPAAQRAPPPAMPSAPPPSLPSAPPPAMPSAPPPSLPSAPPPSLAKTAPPPHAGPPADAPPPPPPPPPAAAGNTTTPPADTPPPPPPPPPAAAKPPPPSDPKPPPPPAASCKPQPPPAATKPPPPSDPKPPPPTPPPASSKPPPPTPPPASSKPSPPTPPPASSKPPPPTPPPASSKPPPPSEPKPGRPQPPPPSTKPPPPPGPPPSAD